MIGQLRVKVLVIAYILQGDGGGAGGTPSNEAFPCTLGQRTYLGLRLGPRVGSWWDLYLHFHLHFISCSAIRSSHTARAGPGPSRIISSCFRMPFLWSGILGTKIFISFFVFFFTRSRKSRSSGRTSSHALLHGRPLCWRLALLGMPGLL